MITLQKAKEKLAEEIQKANQLWEASAPQRAAQDAALKPWHEANRRIEGLKGIIAFFETMPEEPCPHDEHEHGVCIDCGEDITQTLVVRAEAAADAAQDR